MNNSLTCSQSHQPASCRYEDDIVSIFGCLTWRLRVFLCGAYETPRAALKCWLFALASSGLLTSRLPRPSHAYPHA